MLIIHKLFSIGIQGNILKWIKSFLSNRTQQVELDGKKSCSVSVTSGVPQGSVLGPLLFSIFINDLPSIVSGPIFMFADDTKIFRVIRNKEDQLALQNDLNLLHEWSLQWQLNFNVVKCKHLHFGTEHFIGSFYLNNTVIDSVISHKDLGIIFDNHLKFHNHTTEVTAKANCLLGLIRKSFDYLELDMLVTLFVTIVRPTLEYSNPVWGPQFILDQRKLEKVQRRATRLLPSLADKPYPERLSSLQLPSLQYRRLRGDLILLYKILNGYFSSDFPNFFIYSNNITRGHQFKLFKSSSRLKCRSD